MKRYMIFLLTALLMLCLCCAALAEELPIGSTGISITLTSDFQEESLDAEDIADGAVWYRYNDDLDVVAYVYDTDSTLAELVEAEQADSTNSEAGYCSGTLDGLQFGYAAFEDSDDYGSYLCVYYFTVVDGREVDICFFMDSSDDGDEAVGIMNTLRYNGTADNAAAVPAASAAASETAGTAIGSTRLSVVLGTGYTADELTSEDIADDMVNCWYSDSLMIVAYAWTADADSAEEILAQLQEEGTYDQTGVTEINGLPFAYAVSAEDIDGVNYTEIDYLTVLDGQEIQIGFLMLTEENETASVEAANVMNSVALN